MIESASEIDPSPALGLPNVGVELVGVQGIQGSGFRVS